MKKLFKLLFLLCLPLSMASCNNNKEETTPIVYKVELNTQVVNLEVGETFMLEPKALGKDDVNIENIDYIFNSSNPNVAKIEANGRITGLKGGTSTVTCIAGKQIASCLVKVASSGEAEDLAGLSFSPDSVTIKLGASYTPNVVTYPAGIRGLNYVWYSQDESVATVSDGVVSAVGLGSTIVQVVYGQFNAKLNVTVDEKGGDVFTISLNATNKSLLVGTEFQLEAICSEPATITWESENSAIASVDKNGLVSANGRGTTVVSATANGMRASCTFTVKDSSEPTGDPDLEVYFYIDYNVATGDDVPYAKLDWYVGIPFGSSNKPADPATAPDPAFPVFKGWSSHPIVDNIPEDLWDFDKDFVPEGTYVFVLYGIWIDA